MTDKEKLKKHILKEILLLSTGGFEIVQGNFNFTRLKNYWQIDINGQFRIKDLRTGKFWTYTVDYEELGRLAAELNSDS